MEAEPMKRAVAITLNRSTLIDVRGPSGETTIVPGRDTPHRGRYYTLFLGQTAVGCMVRLSRPGNEKRGRREIILIRADGCEVVRRKGA